MATTYGVTSAGFVAPPFEEVLGEVNAAFQAAYGSTIDLSPSQPFGLLAGILATQQMDLWQLAQAVYNARDPNSAEGAGLIELASITGTIPVTPTQSVALVTLTGTSGTVIPAGQTLSVAVAGTQFTTQSVVTLVGGTGTCNALSVAFGPVQALAGTLNVINTPVAGWTAVTNAQDAVLGVSAETDTQLRLRRAQELAASGNATLPGIQSQLIKLTTASGSALLTSATVYDNETDTTDGFGLPPHSMQAIVYYPGAPIAATDAAVAAAIFNSKAAGIATYGAQTQTVVDSNGYPHTVTFDYPTQEWVWVNVTVTAHASSYPGAAAVQAALVNYSQGVYANFGGYGTGSTIYSGPLIATITDNVGGVIDATVGTAITAVGGGTPSTYTATAKAMARNQLPVFSSARISVTVVFV